MSDDAGRTVSYHALPPGWFPLVMEAMTPAGVVVWTHRLERAGTISVPPVSRQHGGVPISIRVTFATGDVVDVSPDGKIVGVR